MAGNPAFFAALKNKQQQVNSGGMGGQSGDSGKGTPPPFMNGGKKKGKADKGQQGAIARRIAAMNTKR